MTIKNIMYRKALLAPLSFYKGNVIVRSLAILLLIFSFLLVLSLNISPIFPSYFSFYATTKPRVSGSLPWFIVSPVLSNVIWAVFTLVRKQSEKILQERERLLTATLSHAAVGILHLSPKGEIIMVNPFFTQLLGYSEGELLSVQMRSLTHPEDLERTNSLITDMLSGATSQYEGEKRYLKKDGSAIWAQHTIRLIRSRKSKPMYFVTIVRDISERKEYERVIDIQRAKMIHNSKMSELDAMSAEIAHEINTPLMIIQMKAEQLRKFSSEKNSSQENILQIAEKIDTTCARIAKTVRSLRNFAHNSEQDPFQTTLVASILTDTLELCSERYKNQGIQLMSESTSQFTSIECRPVQISQVVLNLLNNAFDAVQNLREKWVHVSISETENEVRITIKDSGEGITPELREKIIQPFFTTKESGKGTGLGLSISMEIVKAHKGTLVVDPSCQNTCFVVTLPKKQMHAQSEAA